MAMLRPRTWSFVQPKVFSACTFQSLIRHSESMEIKASYEFSRITLSLFSLFLKDLKFNPTIGCAMRRSATCRRSVGPRFSIYDHRQTKDILSISRWR